MRLWSSADSIGDRLHRALREEAAQIITEKGLQPRFPLLVVIANVWRGYDYHPDSVSSERRSARVIAAWNLDEDTRIRVGDHPCGGWDPKWRAWEATPREIANLGGYPNVYPLEPSICHGDFFILS